LGSLQRVLDGDRWFGPEQDLLGEPLDFGRLPPELDRYDRYCNRPVTKSPIVVRISMFPWRSSEEVLNLDSYSFRSCWSSARKCVCAAVKIPYSPVLGGVSIGIGLGSSGTLGGIVMDSSGSKYGVTCGHVVTGSFPVEHPALSNHSVGKTICSATYCTALKPSGGRRFVISLIAAL